MDFTFTDDEELLRDTVRSFALSRLLPEMPRWRTEAFPRELIHQLGDLGLLGIKIPGEYGGSDGTYVALGIAAEELSRGDFNVSYFVQLSTISALLLSRADCRYANAGCRRSRAATRSSRSG